MRWCERLSISLALQTPNACFVDVRTPLEFEDGFIPGAVNIPILSNEERIIVGTLYKQKGENLARERGLEIISPKLPSLFSEIKKVSKGQNLILYCWRGGLRSQTVASIVSLTGLTVKTIEGGYKSYRNEVLSVLNGMYPFELITLYGLTGSGKTALLKKMKKEGFPVIDLEELACHRGSVFGQIGIEKKQTQKNFEALLYNEIQRYRNASLVFIEGESRRIGQVILPQNWMKHMEKGRKILIRSSLEVRTQRILNEYFLNQEKDTFFQIEEALNSIRKRLGGQLFTEIYDYFKKKDYAAMTRTLLEKYYDRNYRFSAHGSPDEFTLVFDNNTIADEGMVIQLLDTLFQKKVI